MTDLPGFDADREAAADSQAERVRRLQTDFDREQAMADLDESVASREQAVSDHEQERLDVLQSGLEAEIELLPGSPHASHVDIAHRQAALTRAQQRRDTRQQQLDEAQDGRDEVQDFLDAQQIEIEDGIPLTVDDAELASQRRLDAAVARAESAMRRARAAQERLEAARQRFERRHR